MLVTADDCSNQAKLRAHLVFREAASCKRSCKLVVLLLVHHMALDVLEHTGATNNLLEKLEDELSGHALGVALCGLGLVGSYNLKQLLVVAANLLIPIHLALGLRGIIDAVCGTLAPEVEPLVRSDVLIRRRC